LAYEGTNYHGWQSQLNAISVQSELEKCLSLKFGNQIKLTGCGRTDTGVHARQYFAHFDVEIPFDLSTKITFINQLNQFLPCDIVVFDLVEVNPTANARYDALSRTYKYYISRKKNPFNRLHTLYIDGSLDIVLMQQACSLLFDYEDFTSFSKLHTNTKTNNCLVYHASWEINEDKLVFTITANRFLRNMVRAIVGTMIVMGKGKLTIEDFREVIESKDRSKAGFSVPGKALFLEEITYPAALFSIEPLTNNASGNKFEKLA